MRNVQIIINREVADFYSQEDLAPRVTKQLFNAENITQVSGDYAININFPITQNNRKIFSYIDMLQTNKSFYDLRLLPTVITLDGDTLIEGNLQVKQITNRGFECTLVSKGISWVSQIKNNSIRDIDLRPIYFSGNKSIQSPNQWSLSVEFSGSITGNILTVLRRGNYNTFTQFGILLDGDIITGPGIPDGTRIVKQLTSPPFTIPGPTTIWPTNLQGLMPLRTGEILGGAGIYLLDRNATTAGATIMQARPYWWDETEGHYDLFFSTSQADLGRDEVSGEFDFAMPLISYGNFKYPYIEGYIIDNPLNSNYQLVVTYTSVSLNIDDYITPVIQNLFPLGVTVQIIGQDFGTPGYVGTYGLTFGTLTQEYGSADKPLIFTTLIENFPIQDKAILGGYYFYNNYRQGLTNISLFPCPYLGTTVAGMFKQYGKNVAGNFFSDAEYKNLIIPFTTSEDAPWNWGILARLGVEFNHQPSFPLLDADYNKQPFNQGANTKEFLVNGHLTQFCRVNTSQVLEISTGDTGPTPSTVTVNEKYLYDQTFFDDFGILNTPSHESFKCVVDGKYRFSYYLKDFGAHTFFGAYNQDWNRNTPINPFIIPRTNDRFFFIVVKRTDNIFTGTAGRPFIDYQGVIGNYRTSDGNDVSLPGIYIFPNDQVCYVQTFDTTGGQWNSLDVANIGIDILFDVNVTAGETLEVIFVAGNASSGLGLTRPGFSIKYTGLTQQSSMSCYPLTYEDNDGIEYPFETYLYPSKFLPDISQDNFLKSVMNTFNLFLYPDNTTDTIHINDFDNNFLPSGVSEDWTEKCSVDDPNIVLTPLNTFKKVNFYEVTDSNDVLTNWITQPVISVENDSPNFTNIKNINLIFSSTEMRDYYNASAEGWKLYPRDLYSLAAAFQRPISVFSIPTMSDNDVHNATVFELQRGDVEFSYDFNIRILKYLGLQYFQSNEFSGLPSAPFTPGYTYIEDVFVDTTPPQAIIPPNRFQTYRILPMAESINFEYNNIWKKWLDVVTNNTKIDLPVWLLSKDINSIDLRKPITIGSDTYYINRVFQFSPIEQTRTRVSLFKKK